MTISTLRLTQILTLSVFAVAVAGVLGQDMKPELGTDLLVHYGAIGSITVIFLAVIFTVAFILIRLGTRSGPTYWTMPSPEQQVLRISILIGAIVCVQILLDSLLANVGFGDLLTARALGLIAWTLIPAAFLHFGIVKWPTRIDGPSRQRLFIWWVVSLGLAATWSFTAFFVSNLSSEISLGPLLVLSSASVVAAAGEEVVFRALLLTALLGIAGSRMQAVLISSVVFGAMHAPYVFSVPLIYGDWHMLVPVALDYAPRFVGQVAAGLAFGVIWLRTGSISLATATHATLNLGVSLGTGY